MSNKQTGTNFEKAFAELLSSHSYWVHRYTDNRNGQPCDIEACRNNITYHFDCKTCAGDSFSLSRIEANQHSAFDKLMRCGCDNNYFAIRFGDGTVMLLDYSVVCLLDYKNIKKIKQSDTCLLSAMDFLEGECKP